ncbi:zinc-binding dehydrogenase [Paenibacillus cremeus]|uniref:Zinc-binding dehydrogenase n=1 Tax=Paenibacillus cremeus TaxID=2163881 RepID=A0A559K0K2_9BACL|nr:zinc-binding dehydrogenase [Paenibacillus cremeus]TVY05679.1 zinc-binding dehydrogenase [Paenibacillus cremeus]
MIEPAAIAFRGLEKIKITPGDTLAIIGPGPIGLLTTAMAKVCGVRKVVLIGFQPNRLALGLKLGADHIIDISKEDYLERAMDCTNGEGFTAIEEASGNAQAIAQHRSDYTRVCIARL